MEGVNLGHAERRGMTEKAIRVYVEDLDEEVWVPKSVIHEDSEVWEGSDGEEGDLVVNLTFAERQGWA